MFSNSLKYKIHREVNARLHDPIIPLKGHLQNRVWNPRGSKSFRLVAVTLLQKSDRPHRQEFMDFFLHWESDAGESYLEYLLFTWLI